MEGQASRRLTVRAPRECATSLRVVFEWDIEVDPIEVVFQVNGRLNVANLEACVDTADNFKFGADLENAVCINQRTDPCLPATSGFRESVLGDCETWNAFFEECDIARADLSSDISSDA